MVPISALLKIAKASYVLPTVLPTVEESFDTAEPMYASDERRLV
jgi:hypothetical protein